MKLEKDILRSSVGANWSSFQSEMTKMIHDSENFEDATSASATKPFDDSSSESDGSTLNNSWDLLGLRAIKVKHDDEVIPNVLTKQKILKSRSSILKYDRK